MAPAVDELATLRALTFRISSTPTSQLPQHVPAISASLANCRAILSSAQPAGSKASSPEPALAVHKYRTLLSTLLQHRTIHGRWAAVVLIKATIEVGGWETLQKSLPWVRGLLGFLTKPDPPSSKKLCIITLTRIFLLTREYPTLVREITTPSLPAFVQSSLQILNSSGPSALVQTVLESFNELLPKHPNIFRSYLKQLQPFLAHLIAPTPSSKLGQEQEPGPNATRTSQVMHAARQLYVQIPCCAPKGASGEDWSKSLKSTINGAHRVADRVFRAVLEDWQPATRDEPVMSSHMLDDEVQGQDEDGMGLPLWSGIFAGSERLVGLLRLLKEHLESPTANAVIVNLAAIMDLIARILALNAPASGSKSFQHASRLNNQVGKEERDNLWLMLPGIHVAATEVLLALVNRSRASTLALDSLIIDQLVWVFASEKDIVQIRAACYVLITTLLKRSGATLAKPTIDSLVPLIKACCEDLLPSEVSNGPARQTSGQAKANGNSQPQSTANADTFLIAAKSVDDPVIGLHGLKEAASDLLPALLTYICAQYLSDSARARLDRTAILIQHKDAMVASVLNPPPSKKFGKPATSILPLMARSFPQEKVVEATLRPRMPVIRLGEQDVGDEDETDDLEAEDDDMAEQEEGLNKEEDHFVGQALETLLSAEQADGAVQDFSTLNTSKVGAETISLEANEPGNMKNNPFSAADAATAGDIGKRALSDHVLPSPSKRVKTSTDEQPMSHPTQPASTIATSLKNIPTDVPLLTTPEFTATSKASMVPKSLKARLDDMDSDDDDDVGPLVLGPDTDDESE